MQGLSVIIPAFNEEDRILFTLREIDMYCKRRFFEYEIIVIDDGSTDKTFSAVSKMRSHNICVFQNLLNRGKGYSIKKGVRKSRFPLILFTDSDLATPIEELDALLAKIGGSDIVIGSRNLDGSVRVVNQSVQRQILGKAFSSLVYLATGLDLKDTQCGFKLFRKEAADICFNRLTIDRFAFDVELLYIAKKYGLKVEEVPVRWTDKPGSKVHIIKDSLDMLKDVLAVVMKDISGIYD